MIWVRSTRHCEGEGGVVDSTDLASSRLTWGMRRSHDGVSEKTGGEALVAKGVGHSSMEAARITSLIEFRTNEYKFPRK